MKKRSPVCGIAPAVALVLAVLLPLVPAFRSEGHRFELSLVLVYAMVGVAVTMVVGVGAGVPAPAPGHAG